MDDRTKKDLREAYFMLSEAPSLYAHAKTSAGEDLLWAVAKVSEELGTKFEKAARASMRSCPTKDGETLVYGGYAIVPRDIMTKILYTLEEASSEDRIRYRNRQQALDHLDGCNEKTG